MRYVGITKDGRPTAKPHVVREAVFAQPGVVCAERVEAVRANAGGSGASKVLGLDSAPVQERSSRDASTMRPATALLPVARDCMTS